MQNRRQLYQTGMGSPDFTMDATEDAARSKGAPFHGFNGRRTQERCVITDVSVDQYVCVVYTESGGLHQNVPVPPDTMPAIGSREYALSYSLGMPTLVRINHEAQQTNDEDSTHRVTAVGDIGGDDPFFQNRASGNMRGSKPRDMLPGDWVKSGDDGNLIGVLAGGVTLMKASELAQIIMTQASHLVRVLGKNIVIDNGMGSMSLKTDEGKSTFDLKLGADEGLEGNPDAENWRIRAELGTEGEMVDFRVTDGKGRPVYRTYVDPDGRVQVEQTQKVELVAGARIAEVGGNDELEVGGSRTTDIVANNTTRVGGTNITEAGGQNYVRAAGNAGVSAGRDLELNAVRNMTATASGAPNGGADSMKFNVSNGDVRFDIGNPLNGDSQLRRSGMKVNTLTGDMIFETQLGSFNVNTTLPGRCKLGGPGNFGLFSAVLQETMASLLRALVLWMDTHIHPQPALGGVPTAPPVVPSSPIILPLIPLTKSVFVKLGG